MLEVALNSRMCSVISLAKMKREIASAPLSDIKVGDPSSHYNAGVNLTR